ncbi:hypothetical protein AB5I41_20490 [Sphingomonas sp. MMS24-JH45]
MLTGQGGGGGVRPHQPAPADGRGVAAAMSPGLILGLVALVVVAAGLAAFVLRRGGARMLRTPEEAVEAAAAALPDLAALDAVVGTTGAPGWCWAPTGAWWSSPPPDALARWPGPRCARPARAWWWRRARGGWAKCC